MAESAPKVYWEASPFVALIWNEPARAAACEAILNKARAGTIELYTSWLTPVEAYRAPGSLTDEGAELVNAGFFDQPWIRKVPLDGAVAEQARRLQRRFRRLDARDAIHLATAVYLGVGFLHTYDYDDLLRLNGLVEDIVIEEPVEH